MTLIGGSYERFLFGYSHPASLRGQVRNISGLSCLYSFCTGGYLVVKIILLAYIWCRKLVN